jgi:hypothetical protein
MDHQLQIREPRTFRLSNGWGPTTVLPSYAPVDATLYVLQDSEQEELEMFWDENCYYISGPILEREKTAPDRRYTLFGSGGILTRLMPATLEAKGISCLHATSVYNPEKNHMMVFAGGPGAGKTILLLESTLRRDYRLVTTEYTHFQTIDGDVHFYTGSVFDNVRAGNLIYNYTEYEKIWGKEILNTMDPVANPWNFKVALDMTPLLSSQEVITNPKVSLIFVKIEGQRDIAVVEELKKNSAEFQLYMNASELITRPRLFYGTLPSLPFDSAQRAANRLKIVRNFLSTAVFVEMKALFAGVNNAWVWGD